MCSRNSVALVVIEQGDDNCKYHGRERITHWGQGQREKETTQREKDSQRQVPSRAFALP